MDKELNYIPKRFSSSVNLALVHQRKLHTNKLMMQEYCRSRLINYSKNLGLMDVITILLATMQYCP